MSAPNLLIIHLVSCAFMTGLIWVIQILHYPMFGEIKEDTFVRVHKNHSTKITWIVLPMMLIELTTSVALIYLSPQIKLFWLNSFGVFVTWACTLLLSVPLHEILSQEQNQLALRRLVTTNWWRTILWSVRLILLVLFSIQNVSVVYGNISN